MAAGALVILVGDCAQQIALTLIHIIINDRTKLEKHNAVDSNK